MDIQFSTTAQNLWSAGGLLFWIIVYILMVRRGFKDRSYGMPIVALFVNVAWESYYAFFTDVPMMNKVGAALYLVFDIGVVWTAIKFAKDDFDSALIKRYLNHVMIVTTVAAFFLIAMFDRAFNDPFGPLSAGFTTMLLSILMLCMLFRRDSVKGQSFYIGLFILLGDVAGYFMTLIAKQTVQDNIWIPWVNTVNAIIIGCNIVYLILYVQVARRDGVNPWTRW